MTNKNDVCIKPGTYRIVADVANPCPDRRERYDWRKLAVWRAGTEFFVRDQSLNNDPIDAGLSPEAATRVRVARTYTVVELVGDRYPGLHQIGPGHDEQYAVLAAALVPTEESANQFMTRIDCHDHFARWLLDENVFTRGQLEELWRRFEYGDESADSTTTTDKE